MSTDPYAPPSAPIEPDKSGARPFVCVLVGVAIDIGGSVALTMLISFAYVMVLLSNEADPQKVAETLMHGGPPWFVAVTMTLGCALSILGGYVCTRMARRRDYRLGLAMVGITIVISALMTLGTYSVAKHVGYAALEFACVMLGTRMGFARS